MAEFDQAWQRYQGLLNDRLLPMSWAGNRVPIDRHEYPHSQRPAGRTEVAAIRKTETLPMIAKMREAMDTLAAQTVVKAQEEKATAEDDYVAGRILVKH